MKKRFDSVDLLLNLSILLLCGLLLEHWFFSPSPSDNKKESSLAKAKPSPQENHSTNQKKVPNTPNTPSQTKKNTPQKENTLPEKQISPAPQKGSFDFEAIEKEHCNHLTSLNNKIIIRKLDHQLFLMDGDGHLLGPFPIAIGKNPDRLPKEREGDKRTPEGEYKIRAVMGEENPVLQEWNAMNLTVRQGHHKFGKPDEDLGTDSYGPRFLLLNYPNPKDKELGRTGSGIGIHGTNDPNSLGYEATSGCIRMLNPDICWLSKWVQKDTPVLIEKTANPTPSSPPK